MSIAFTRKHAKHENIQSLPFSYDMEMATDSYSTTILWKAYSIFLYNSWNNFSWSPFHLLFFHLYFQNLPYLCNENRSHSGMSVIVTRNMNLTHEYDNWQSLFYCYTVEDWDLFEKMMDNIYKKNIKSDSTLHPVLMSEASVSTWQYLDNHYSVSHVYGI